MSENEITINYGSDFNILKIHNQILKIFLNKEPIHEKIRCLTYSLNKERLTSVKKYIQSKIDIFQKELDDYKYKNYLEESKEIINTYTDIIKNSNLFEKKKDLNVLIPIFDNYILILKKYINVQFFYDQEYICSECIQLYEICGCSKKIDTTLNNIKLKNEYENEVNFTKALMKYQGRQGIKFDNELFKNLDSYFKKYSLPIGEDIKKLKHNTDGTKDNTSIKMLFDALYEIKRTDLYSDINLLCHEYWGWILPDISEVYEQILIDYRKTQKVFESLHKERSSCLNLPYRIFKHLQIYNPKVKSKDFRLPTTHSILKSQDLLWKQMCQGANLKFIPTI